MHLSLGQTYTIQTNTHKEPPHTHDCRVLCLRWKPVDELEHACKEGGLRHKEHPKPRGQQQTHGLRPHSIPDEADAQLHERQEASREHRVSVTIRHSRTTLIPDEAGAQLHERQEANREHRVSVTIRQSRTTLIPDKADAQLHERQLKINNEKTHRQL